jgi:hypothetical protein
MANNNTPNFLDIPKPHHHVSRLLVLVIILAVIILVAWLVSYLWQNKQTVTVTVPAVPHALANDDRLMMLTRPSDVAPINPTLSDAQRAKLLTKPSKTAPI